MTFDSTKPVQTRSGLKAEILSTKHTKIGSDEKVFEIISIITEVDGNSQLVWHMKDGRYYYKGSWDLVNIPEEKTLYTVVYSVRNELRVGTNFYKENHNCLIDNINRNVYGPSEIIQVIETKVQVPPETY